MKITSAKFIKGITGDDKVLRNGIPQIAFIGRSNAGKSTLLNSLAGVKKLAITSKAPGRTREINIFLINKTHYFMDLPGYGFAKVKFQVLDDLRELILWYLFDAEYNRRVVLLIDSVVGPTKDDLDILQSLERDGKEIIIVLNKVDKIKNSHYKKQLDKLADQFPGHKLFPYSSKTKVGAADLLKAIFKK